MLPRVSKAVQLCLETIRFLNETKDEQAINGALWDVVSKNGKRLRSNQTSSSDEEMTYQLVTLFIHYKADINYTRGSYNSVLAWACRNHQFSTVILLLCRGAPLNGEFTEFSELRLACLSKAIDSFPASYYRRMCNTSSYGTEIWDHYILPGWLAHYFGHVKSDAFAEETRFKEIVKNAHDLDRSPIVVYAKIYSALDKIDLEDPSCFQKIGISNSELLCTELLASYVFGGICEPVANLKEQKILMGVLTALSKNGNLHAQAIETSCSKQLQSILAKTVRTNSSPAMPISAAPVSLVLTNTMEPDTDSSVIPTEQKQSAQPTLSQDVTAFSGSQPLVQTKIFAPDSPVTRGRPALLPDQDLSVTPVVSLPLTDVQVVQLNNAMRLNG